MPEISIEIICTFFGDASEDAEKHLFNFKSTCHDFNLTKDNVPCRLFLQIMQGKQQRRRFSELASRGPLYIRMLRNTIEPTMYAKE
jgi:hypothetical protein